MYYLKRCPRCNGDIVGEKGGDSVEEDRRVIGYSCIQCGFSPTRQLDYYSPMLARLSNGAFDSDKHIYEPKYDGIRCLTYRGNRTTKLLNRSANDITERFPELTIETLCPCILDGEIVINNEEGVPNFQKMQTRMNRIKDIAQHSVSTPADYYVFDIMAISGWDICTIPLIQRKALLAQVLVTMPNVHIVPYQRGNGIALFKSLSERHWEGIMAKDALSPYIPGAREKVWYKIKAIKESTVTVIGCTVGFGRRSESFGALIVAGDAGEFQVHLGEVGTGFTDQDLYHLTNRMRKLILPYAPDVENLPQLPVKWWLEPKIKIRVAYQDLTDDNKLRFPSYQGEV
jgi:bifunctional non-homologous end joining protein LigD